MQPGHRGMRRGGGGGGVKSSKLYQKGCRMSSWHLYIAYDFCIWLCMPVGLLRLQRLASADTDGHAVHQHQEFVDVYSASQSFLC